MVDSMFGTEITSDQRVVTNQLNQKEVRSIKALKWGDGFHIAMEVTREGRIVSASHLYPEDRDQLRELWPQAKDWLASDSPRYIKPPKPEEGGEGESKTEKAQKGERISGNGDGAE